MDTSATDRLFDLHLQARTNMLQVVSALSLEQVNRIPQGLNNNVLWNAGHVIATSELLVYALSGHRTPSGKDFIDRYRKGSRPDGPASLAELDFIKAELLAGSQRLRHDYAALDWSGYTPYTTSFGVGFGTVEEALTFNNMHETLHLGAVLVLQRLV
ncbi:hypothetical protein LEM8419_03245 [Neolewinella maritima]|uniref:DinB-like domain-containing protein n=1 Tax=Neolewinella maritima TaxID=1383882 RepID=A0ABM9B4Y4_9BACT|nr:DinB family protein [Neolewinella maritima]CAH1002338.1 hypothetical protein LEM8419_03245 [Neolewinella maritima]